MGPEKKIWPKLDTEARFSHLMYHLLQASRLMVIDVVPEARIVSGVINHSSNDYFSDVGYLLARQSNFDRVLFNATVSLFDMVEGFFHNCGWTCYVPIFLPSHVRNVIANLSLASDVPRQKILASNGVIFSNSFIGHAC